ncbi:MAG: integrase core domain-containing protein [Kosmotogaceae bacterium]
MKIIENIAKWICRTLTRDQVLSIIEILNDFLYDPDIQFKNAKPAHPNYRKFEVDPEPPLDVPEIRTSQLDFRKIIKDKKIKPVANRGDNKTEKHIRCPHCNASHNYIYKNNGKRQNTQYQCKVCKNTFCSTPKISVTKFLCPICGKALYKWKTRPLVTLYKCGNDKCQRYIDNLNKLSDEEKILQKQKTSQFKLRYIYRDYKINLKNILSDQFKTPLQKLGKFTYSLNTIGLVLTFYITLQQSSRMTAFALRGIFGIKISHTSVTRIAKAASAICHQYNLKYIPKVKGAQAADETYIKVLGKHHYTWLSVSEYRSIITSYQVSDNRGEIPAINTLVRANDKHQKELDDEALSLIVDGNPSYQAAATFLKKEGINIDLKKVIGLENKDNVSALFRYLKNIIERVNRTYKHYAHNCFQNIDGAASHLALAVTNYNFIRLHSSLGYKTPVCNNKLDCIELIQDKWVHILNNINL